MRRTLGGMRARPLRLLAAVAAGVIALVVTATGPAVAATTDDAAPHLRVEVLEIRSAGLDELIALMGAPHRVDVAVRVTNTGARVESDVVARVETASSLVATAPVRLAPGESMSHVVTVRVSGMPGTDRDIVVSAGDTGVVVHGRAPWLLLGAVVLGLHVAALDVRNRLRARIARSSAQSVVQPSPSHTWARSRR